MILSALLPPEAQPRLAPYALLVVIAAVLRATSALALAPLLAALASPTPRAALPWLAVLAASVVAGWRIERGLVLRAFDLGFVMMNSMNARLIDRPLTVSIGWFGADRQAQAKRALAGAVPELFASSINLGTQTAVAIVAPPAIAIGLLFVAWPLGVAALVATPALFGALILGARLMRQADKDYAAASEEAAARTEEFARAQLILRAAGRAHAEDAPLAAALDGQRRAGLRMLYRTIPGTLIFSLAMQATLLAFIGVLALMFAGGMAEGPAIVALMVVILRFLDPFNTLSELFPALESTRGAAERTLAILDAPAQSQPATDAAPGLPEVELRNAHFRPQGIAVLTDVSFIAPAGTTTAIVGPSGSGKSTILALVARLHDVDAGEARVGGHDVRDYLPATLMSQLSIVFQNVQLFEGSIVENIRIGRPEASDAQWRAAASAAGVDEIVARLGGWDAPVGEGGAALSGGERQRVSIARALLKDAPILLLDEATSGLDALNEAAVGVAMRRFAGRTVLIVAHRLETIAHADRIIFVEGGRIVEAGGREELIAAGGRFARYWRDRDLAAHWRFAR